MSGPGDRDTAGAMVGGIMARSSRQDPRAWLASRDAPPADVLLALAPPQPPLAMLGTD